MFDAAVPHADNPAMPKALPYAALLFPVTAYATPCKDFACHFSMIGGFLGLIGGIPISGVVFIVLHMALCNRGRSQLKQGIVGAMAGVLPSSCPRFPPRSWRRGGRPQRDITKAIR